MQTKLGSGRVAHGVLTVDDPDDLRRILLDYFVPTPVPSPNLPAALQALGTLSRRAAAREAAAASPSRTSPQHSNSSSGGSSGSGSSGSNGSSGSSTTQPSRGNDDILPTAAAAPAADQQQQRNCSSIGNRNLRGDPAGDDSARDTSPTTAAAPNQQKCQKRTCAGCGGRGEKRCGGCRRAWYCSKGCQSADWPKHKLECVPKQQG